ncbi:MAG: T9SS type A sorting domain-containing protein [Ignavibacteria bacterium]|nr:T9SS type A sorting domain-containing protein [Ignavibacteria bacterium]
MNRFCTATLCLALLLLATVPIQMFAQASDTLVVYATPKALDEVIRQDTTAGGVQKHKVYKLVSLDTTYLYTGSITVKSDITVLGVRHATTGRPPCIQPAVLGDGSIPATLFVLNGKNMKGTFKNLYLLGLSTNGNANGDGIAIRLLADSIRLTVDNCVFEEWHTFAISYSGSWCKFYISNSKFRNMVHPNQWYIGEVLRNEWPGTAYTDTVIFRYNTMFCINGYASATVTKYYTRFFEFTHNSVLYTFKNPFFEFNVTDAKFNNNLFFSPWSGAISKQEYPWWDQLWSPEVGSIIDLDTLDLAKDSVFNPVDIGKTNFRLLSEAKRKVEVKNNAYFWPTALTTFWKNWNDTARVCSVYTPTWMNARTSNMFANKTTWPGFVSSGNLNADPGFGTSIPAVLSQSPNGLLAWFTLCRTGQLSTTYWGYQKTQVGSAANWVPTWPLPETQHMQYTNTSLRTGGTDGLPIGDPNWFGITTAVETSIEPIPQEFSLSPAYPNPFNPSTNIQYTLNRAGVTTLRVYNTIGQLVRIVVDGIYQSPGTYTMGVEMSDLPTGMYIYVLQQENNRIARKMMLLK